MDDLFGLPSAPLERRRGRVVTTRLPEQDRPQIATILGHPERQGQSLFAPEVPHERPSEPGLGRPEQQQQRGEPAVDKPVGHGPALATGPEPAFLFVRLPVPRCVGPGMGEEHDGHGGLLETGPASGTFPPLLCRRRLPEDRRLGRPLKHHRVPAPAVSRRRSPQRPVEDSLEHRLGDGPAREAPDHPPPPQGLPELHSRRRYCREC